ncbi:16S rRNA (cytosine(1402)-N(4))-methyltransferase RsmH [Candidatus Nomurabacteria bacterium]|nr:16S rRNA (cytosine(1402)-N(4))-methyltransferase RsmH [Candidatus Nomurabacteria bacterium]
MQSVHKTVLLKETIDGLNLNLNNESIVVDSTFGGGGHSVEILKKFPKSKVIGIDQDKSAWGKAKEKFKGMEKRISFVNANFSELGSVVEDKKVDGIIFDLGLSSDQLENAGRGFSFMKDEPLLMTMKEDLKEEDLTAKEIVNTWEEKNLADIIYGYGEERYARRIAKAIVEAREKEEIQTTFDLVRIIESAVPSIYKRGRIHYATRTFQALRIAVNDELRVLEKGLESGFEMLKKGRRMSVITFHSLEDRIVKRFYKKLQQEEKAILINKKPIIATSEEIKNNPRSRSAKLRILEKN